MQELPTIDLRYAGVQTIPVPAGFCFDDPSFLLLFAVNTWDRQTHADAPASFEWDIDIDQDGEADYAVFNFELAGDLTDGRNAVFTEELDGDNDNVFFLTDHATNSANTVLTICAEQIGLTGEDFFTLLTATGGRGPLLHRSCHRPDPGDGVLAARRALLPADRRFTRCGTGSARTGTAELTALDFGVSGTNPSETGMLLFTDGTYQVGSSFPKTGSPQANEALVVRVSSNLPLDDILGHTFADDIVWAFENGITSGCSTDPPLLCPNDTGAQARWPRSSIARWTSRTRRRTTSPMTTASTHEDSIESSPGGGDRLRVHRDDVLPELHRCCARQMATFLDRAFDPPNTARRLLYR